MCTFPVWDMFTEVGTVSFADSGLYYDYSAAIRTGRPDFIRLYCHNDDDTTRLGVFSLNEDLLTCGGRVSKRTLGKLDESTLFSIHKDPFYKLKTPLDGGYLPQNALYKPQKGRRFVIIRHENSLPDEVLPYFCFLQLEGKRNFPKSLH